MQIIIECHWFFLRNVSLNEHKFGQGYTPLYEKGIKKAQNKSMETTSSEIQQETI